VRALMPEWVSLSMQVSEVECESEDAQTTERLVSNVPNEANNKGNWLKINRGKYHKQSFLTNFEESSPSGMDSSGDITNDASATQM
jgi:hypothetical protein